LSSVSTTRSTSRPFLWVPTTRRVVIPIVAVSTEMPQEPRTEVRQSKIDWLWIKLGLFGMLFPLGLLNMLCQILLSLVFA
jgi:hypothetical protein